MPSAAILARLNSIKPGLITISDPRKPIITADHLLNPTLSFNKNGENAVTTKGHTNAKVSAFAIDIFERA